MITVTDSAISSRCHRPQRGFTLIELLVVMILVAMLSGMVIYSVSGHVDAAALSQTVDQLTSLDRRVRAEARRKETAITLQFDGRDSLVSMKSNLDLVDSNIGDSISINQRIAIQSVRVGGVVRGASQAQVRVNALGQSSSYALELETGRGASSFLVFLGMSGQAVRVSSEDEASALLRP